MSELERQLLDALDVRLSPIEPRPIADLRNSDFAVLFSGGVDCTLLALLADTVMKDCEVIDLLNVAFENPRIVTAAGRSLTGSDKFQCPFSQCPDRKSALSSYHQLVRMRPQRQWRLILIDVPYVEASAHKTPVSNLIYPHNTEMDLSIALAFYFASRGTGKVVGKGHDLYTTTARVLLSGLGADELFAGYSRHTRAFQKTSYEGLLNEIDLDFGRIGKRNLGRDDRVTAHWGREIRYPYLDETFARWALRLPIWEKCGFGIREDVRLGEQKACEPGKLILRLLAWKLGLEHVACEKKRAIQFGSRTARMAESRRKGHELI